MKNQTNVNQSFKLSSLLGELPVHAISLCFVISKKQLQRNLISAPE